MAEKTYGFIPLLLAGDINVYSVARAFHEEYGIKSYCFGKFPSGPCYGSSIINYQAIADIETQDGFMREVVNFAQQHNDKKILLIGCGDSYVALVSKNKENLPTNVIAPYIDFSLMDELQHKATFYELCDRHSVLYPKTFIHDSSIGDDFSLDFDFPVILKPSTSIPYWEHPFEGQEKVYTIPDRSTLLKVMHQIYDAGYDDKLIIQDMIPGNDEYMHVLTTYSDKNGKVKMMCLGHVLLEEHTPHGKGNHALILTEENAELCAKVKDLLEELNYVGFANFDIKFDSRDETYRFFEINTRQGRSNYYVTNSGLNVARLFVDDYIENKELPFIDHGNRALWTVVPKKVALTYVKQAENLKALKEMFAKHDYANPLFYKKDKGIRRFLANVKNHFSHVKKYKTYYN